ncbi:MAG: class II aldolase/adducin family protein [Alphaproteobacteria bacterium]|nr:class II aldolase/adducin family protein [Alphaproteobacteria bacterium]
MTDAPTAERLPNSLRGTVSDAEWNTRVALAAGCRIAQHFGWNNSIRNHLTARVPDEPEKFLMNPVGLMWNEITASDFLKVDFDGKVYTESDMPPGPAGLSFHGAILKANPERNCSFHLHETAGVVVSAMADGLIYTNQESLALYGLVGYHPFEGLADEAAEGPRIAQELGDNVCMVMWNHGLLSVGRSIHEGFYFMQRLVEACQIQVRLMASGAEIRHIPKEVCEHTYRQFQKRAQNRPLGLADWKAYLRLADRLDPSYKL